MIVTSRLSDAMRPIVQKHAKAGSHTVWQGDECIRKYTNGYILIMKKRKDSIRYELLVYSPRVVQNNSHLLAVGPDMSMDDYLKAQEVVLYFRIEIEHDIAIERLQTIRDNKGLTVLLSEDSAQIVSREVQT